MPYSPYLNPSADEGAPEAVIAGRVHDQLMDAERQARYQVYPDVLKISHVDLIVLLRRDVVCGDQDAVIVAVG